MLPLALVEYIRRLIIEEAQQKSQAKPGDSIAHYLEYFNNFKIMGNSLHCTCCCYGIQVIVRQYYYVNDAVVDAVVLLYTVVCWW